MFPLKALTILEGTKETTATGDHQHGCGGTTAEDCPRKRKVEPLKQRGKEKLLVRHILCLPLSPAFWEY